MSVCKKTEKEKRNTTMKTQKHLGKRDIFIIKKCEEDPNFKDELHRKIQLRNLIRSSQK